MLITRFYDLWRIEGVQPSEALRRAQLWLRDSTNKEKVEYFKGILGEFGGDGRLSAEAVAELYKAVSLLEPLERSFAQTYFWAAFCYFGV